MELLITLPIILLEEELSNKESWENSEKEREAGKLMRLGYNMVLLK